MEELKRIYKLLNIPLNWKIVSIRKHRIKRKGKEYIYYNVNMVKKWGEKPKQKYIPKRYEKEVLELWKTYREKKEKLKSELKKKLL